MGSEIERRYLVDQSLWQRGLDHKLFLQGYLSTDPARVVRVRLVGLSPIHIEEAFLTIKGKNDDIERPEWEYRIPVKDGKEQLQICSCMVTKTRYTQVFEGHTWYVDVFHKENHGLVLAEIELLTRTTPFTLPPWVGEEVTHDSKYTNASLARKPFKTWG